MAKKFIRSGWSLLLLAVLVTGGLFALPKKEFAPLPGDSVHAGLMDNHSCTDCHGEGGESPLGDRHPPKEQCLTCHKRQ